jgi:hypothetical protein
MPRPPKTEPTVRLNLELSVSVRTRLERLRITTGGSATEVIRRALTVYDLLLTTNSVIILRDKDGNERILLIP